MRNSLILRWLTGAALALCAVNCSKPQAVEESAPESEVAPAPLKEESSPAAAKDEDRGEANTRADQAAAAKAQPGGEVAPNVPIEPSGEETLSCTNSAQWEAVSLGALQTGTILTPKPSAKPPELEWQACEGIDGCERPKLAPGVSVLGVGALGNELRMAFREECADGEQMLRVVAFDGKPVATMRGEGFVFEDAVLGGDRVLVGGFGKHLSEKAKDGYVKRRYLLTRRDYGSQKIEAVRNKQDYRPHTASSQLVHVRGAKQCTGLFWKIGVEECSFAGPGTDAFTLFGSHLIYRDPATSKGMAWDVKNGPRVLLDNLQWVMTDGVNVVWSSSDALYTTQPRWDLPELKAEPAPGAAGPRPVAYGCGRLLSKKAAGWSLRHIAKGRVWDLDAERLPALETSTTSSAVMNCEHILMSSGERIALRNLGEPRAVVAAAPTPSANASAPPASEAQPASTAIEAPPSGAVPAPAGPGR